MSISKKEINQELVEYTLDNGWMQVSILNYGATITKIVVPNKNGDRINCVLNYQDYNCYYENPLFLGAVVGPVAGRIPKGTFELDGKTYQLEQNEGENHLHGGFKGYHKQFFEVTAKQEEAADKLQLRLKKHQTTGYPGEIDFLITYMLTKENKLTIVYQAETTEKTIFSPTNHTYFNLNCHVEEIGNHQLYLAADQVQEIGEGTLPTGEMLDLKTEKNDLLRLSGGVLQKNLTQDHKQLVLGAGGIDLAYRFAEGTTPPQAVLKNEDTGIKIQLDTTEEAVVVYTGNKILENKFLSEEGLLGKYSGVTLETQALPDSIHQTDGSQVILDKDEIYLSSTVWLFSMED